MVTNDAFSLYIMICILAPLLGAFTLLFLIIFEKRIDILKKQTREIALERELQTALYNQLNQEIQPHFFFNTLNSILSLARLDRKAELITSIETLSKLLKYKYQKNESIITIEEELNYTGYYLEIQKIRFRDRFMFHISIEPDVTHAVIIPFMIQTFVENAFKHSFEKIPGEAILKINIAKMNQVVHLSVWNNSTNLAHEFQQNVGGLGIGNIEKRLNLLFPNEQTSIRLSSTGDGTTVLALFPFKSLEEM
jgi:sensor histidine kinase YesM